MSLIIYKEWFSERICVYSSATTTIAVGESISVIYVLLVSLKHKDYGEATIPQLNRLINQNMVLALGCGSDMRLAVYHTKLIQSAWRPADDCTYFPQGAEPG